MTFSRHLWTCLKFVSSVFLHLPRKGKVVLILVGTVLYSCYNENSQATLLGRVIQRQLGQFVLTVLQVSIPIAYILCRLVFGLLYPAYASYKAVKTKNVKEYVKWMMYWIVFALFCAVETFSDVFLAWLPFYYEIKMIFVFWLLSPVTKGSSFIYRKFVHPNLAKREKEIDEAIAQARTKGYSTIVSLGHKGLSYATNVVVTTAIKGQSTLVEQIKKSYSTNDLRVSNDSVDGGPIDDSDDEYERILEDNRELDKRKENWDQAEKLKRRPLQRSKSDAADVRKRRSKASATIGLSKLDEVEHETSLHQQNQGGDEEEVESYSEEVITYYSPRSRGALTGHYTAKEVKADPYATMPRTRSRHRPRLNQY